jgi:2-aminoadipate transaminase
MQAKGVTGLAPEQLIVTTGSQQALDLLGKCLVDPGSKAIVEGPTFLATIQCFRSTGPIWSARRSTAKACGWTSWSG